MQIDLSHEYDEDSDCKNCGAFGPHAGPVCVFKLGVLVGRAQVDPQASRQYEALLERVKNSWKDWTEEDIEQEISSVQGLLYGLRKAEANNGNDP